MNCETVVLDSPSELKHKIIARQVHVGIIGLGYVGLPSVLLYV
jgi:hypothetical protein